MRLGIRLCLLFVGSLWFGQASALGGGGLPCQPYPICLSGGTVVNYGKVAGLLYEAQIEIKDYVKEKYRAELQDEYANLRSQLGIENSGNTSANEVARTSQAEVDVYNLQQARRGLPAPDACATASRAKKMADVIDEAKCFTEEMGSRRAEDSQEQVIDRREAVAKFVKVYAKSYFNSNLPVRGGLIHGSTSDAYNQSEVDAAKMSIKLLTQITPPQEIDERVKEVGGVSYMNLKMARDSRIAKMSVANSSLESVVSERVTVDGRSSQFSVIKEEVTSRWGGNNSGDIMANVNSPALGEGGLMRYRYQVLANQAFLAVKQYEESLRQETLLAVRLADSIRR